MRLCSEFCKGAMWSCGRRWVGRACVGVQGLREVPHSVRDDMFFFVGEWSVVRVCVELCEGGVELRAGTGRVGVRGRSRIKRGPSLRSG